MKQLLKELQPYLIILALFTGILLGELAYTAYGNNDGGGKCFSHGYRHRFGHGGTIPNTVATPKAPVTSYQFNIVHMTDSIKVYDGARYVGQCRERDLTKLIIKDNL